MSVRSMETERRRRELVTRPGELWDPEEEREHFLLLLSQWEEEEKATVGYS